jgi:hypothetical protein
MGKQEEMVILLEDDKDLHDLAGILVRNGYSVELEIERYTEEQIIYHTDYRLRFKQSGYKNKHIEEKIRRLRTNQGKFKAK